jgi:hypothetical protein
MNLTIWITIAVLVIGLASRPVSAEELGSFNQTDAVRMVIFSAIAHCDKDAIQHWTCAGCKLVPEFEPVYVFRNNITDTGFVGYDAQMDRVVVSYIGTYNLQTLFQDFELGRTHFKNESSDIRVHAGWCVHHSETISRSH